ncbi:ribulose-1 5 bisphosphate carboxylase/oxygenase large subunit n-methyltransferase chloroplastic [Phtheirospermum japonicum]|uniref:Ribulose-1 5 bisphosphate carboxylase/oxygenase large subunit n-methyltransferase chloroplastic n=1 Tax=Phtheirospermum japonicum TaxID=374723 RepID=A0A830CXJ2_9LAMI|nr:ribulose-1 5 bisphosphate carboxylase/oxygenase large subunit n-methyltransferase chloroplastic [Phtheirospermum japonicum]
MAEASIILQTTLVPTFSLQYTLKNHSNLHFPPSISKRSTQFHRIRCSVSTAAESSATQSGVAWGCDADSLENASSLQEWLSKCGLPPQKMAIQRVDVGERGLVALKNIRKGEKLLFVPPALFITSDSEWSCGEAGEVLKKYNVPDWPLLATYLIIGFPTAAPCNFRTRSELDRYLEASEIRQRAIERINDVTGTYDDLRDRIFSKYPDLFPEKVFNMESFKWSFGILFSRLVRLPSMDGKVALVPWADMLNHSCEVETFLDYDKSSQGVVFTTDRAYQPGEQDPRYPEIEEEALQFILDTCEDSISKYSKFLQASKWIDGFGRDKSEASEQKIVLETAGGGFMHQRTEDTIPCSIYTEEEIERYKKRRIKGSEDF